MFSQSELLQKEVFLVETIDSLAKDLMTHLKAVCFLRPTAENMQHLKRIMRNPRFGEYHLCKILQLQKKKILFSLILVVILEMILADFLMSDFSNILKNSYIQILGDSDEHEAVQQVQVLSTLLNHIFTVPYYSKRLYLRK